MTRAVARKFGSDDPWISHGVTRFVAAWSDPQFRAPVLARLDTGIEEQLGAAFGLARALGVPTDAIAERLIRRLGPGAPNAQLAGLLLHLLSGCVGGSYGGVEDAEVPVLKAAWTRFVSENRAALHTVGSVPLDPSTADRALAPTSYRCTLPGDRSWP